jgi:hypothetical protein
VWQQLRAELHPLGVEIVTVGMDTAGAEACRPSIEAANPEHPSLIDVGHVMAERFGVTNIPNGIWIDEEGMIVRPAEVAFAPEGEPFVNLDPATLPGRIQEIFGEGAKIPVDRDAYANALRDWAANGSRSRYVLSPDEVVERSTRRDEPAALGAAHFDLAQHLWRAGREAAATRHFREAHRLQPENIAYKRQAWSLISPNNSPLDRFWQGPIDGHEGEWPYESDWLSEIRALGAENYYAPLDL